MAIGYDIHVFVCENERHPRHPRGSCAARSPGPLREWFKEAMAEHGLLEGNRVNRCGCLDLCEQGPAVVVYPEGVWYRPLSEDDVEEIVREHLVSGKIVERLLLEGTGGGSSP